MVKIYLKYSLLSSFGVITSGPCNSIFEPETGAVFSGALESIIAWNVKRGIQIAQFTPDRDDRKQPIVTKITLSPDNTHLAAGYSNGNILLWNIKTKTIANVFSGHKSEITALAFDKNGHMLVSGSSDTNIIIWDIVLGSGVCKLSGHKNSITDIKFLHKDGVFVVSSSKDFLIKVWDVNSQHCIQTIVGHRAEVWSFDINPEENLLVSGSENLLRFYKIKKVDPALVDKNEDKIDPEDSIEDSDYLNHLVYFGEMERKTKGRVSNVRFNCDGSMLAVQSSGKNVEFLKVHDRETLKERRKTRLKKEKIKAKKKYNQLLEEFEKVNSIVSKKESDLTKIKKPEPIELLKSTLPADQFSFSYILRTDTKIQSLSFSPNRPKHFVLSLSNNTIEVYKANVDKYHEVESNLMCSIGIPGHRSDIRALTLTNNNQLLISASKDLIKVWNMQTFNCIHTIDSGYGLCLALVPGERFLLVGTKAGKIEIYDIHTTVLVDSIDAHTGPIWSLQLNPTKAQFITASADKTVKFWNFEILEPEFRLSASFDRKLDLSDEILCCKITSNGKYILVSLLDSTVKVIVTETGSIFHSLYGHKLPVISIDVSDDESLILTGSADKDIRLWGMDFGDCHKSLFSHTNTIVQVGFIPKSHYFVSLDRDGYLKYWDADKFELVETIPAHYDEAWAMTIAQDGEYVITGSHDKSIRVWERTRSQIVVQLEREKELENKWEETLENEDKYGVENRSESVIATKSTLDSIKAGEKLIDALEMLGVEDENRKKYEIEYKRLLSIGNPDFAEKLPKPQKNELLKDQSEENYLFNILKSIKSTYLEQSILTLPFDLVLRLVKFIDLWIQNGLQIEICARTLFMIIQTYQSQLSATKACQSSLFSIQKNLRDKLQGYKDMIGFNQVTMDFMKKKIELDDNSKFFEAREDLFIKKGPKKQKVIKKYWE